MQSIDIVVALVSCPPSPAQSADLCRISSIASVSSTAWHFISPNVSELHLCMVAWQNNLENGAHQSKSKADGSPGDHAHSCHRGADDRGHPTLGGVCGGICRTAVVLGDYATARGKRFSE